MDKTIVTKNDIVEACKYFGYTRASIEENIDLRHIIIEVPFFSDAFDKHINKWKQLGIRYYVHQLPWWKCRFKKFRFSRVCEQKELSK